MQKLRTHMIEVVTTLMGPEEWTYCGRPSYDFPIQCVTKIEKRVTCKSCLRCIRKRKREANEAFRKRYTSGSIRLPNQ